jgi:hypothetical protein
MTLPPAADALTRWKVAAGDHAIACVVDPGVVMVAVPLTVTG